MSHFPPCISPPVMPGLLKEEERGRLALWVVLKREGWRLYNRLRAEICVQSAKYLEIAGAIEVAFRNMLIDCQVREIYGAVPGVLRCDRILYACDQLVKVFVYAGLWRKNGFSSAAVNRKARSYYLSFASVLDSRSLL